MFLGPLYLLSTCFSGKEKKILNSGQNSLLVEAIRAFSKEICTSFIFIFLIFYFLYSKFSIHFLFLYICHIHVFMQKWQYCVSVEILDQSDDLDLLAFSYEIYLSFSCLYKEFSFCIMDHYICYVQVLVRKHRHWIHDKILY